MPADIFAEFERQCAVLLRNAGIPDEYIFLTRPTHKKFGDLSANAAFELGKAQKQNPRAFAQEVTGKMDLETADLVEKIEVAGPGYINFFLNNALFRVRVLAAIKEAGDSYGDLAPGATDKIVIEHTSVNPNKPWHIGHARNAILGDTLGRFFRQAGYPVEIQNYIDDTGKQVGDTIFALDYFNAEYGEDAGKYDHFVGEQYVQLNQVIEELPEGSEKLAAIKSGIESVMHALEEGRHRDFVERCLKAQLQTAYRLDIFYNILVWESDIVRAKLFQEAMDKIQVADSVYWAEDGYAKGCLVIDMSEFFGAQDEEEADEDDEEHQTEKILIRSNGLATYTGKDIAFQMWKFGLLARNMKIADFEAQPNGETVETTTPDGRESVRQPAGAVINVIGYEQDYPQTVVKTALKVVGYEKQFENSHHLSYGHVWLPEGRMSGRKGIGIATDDVIAETVREAYNVVKEKRGDELGEDALRKIAEAVGMGAVRFAMLQKTPRAQVKFIFEEVVNFKGYTALYAQYAYVRTCSLLAKAADDIGYKREDAEGADVSLLVHESEDDLILTLALFPQTLRDALDRLDTTRLTQYVFDLAGAFNQFYKDCPVIPAGPPLRLARLALTEATRQVLGVALQTLGIPLLERM